MKFYNLIECAYAYFLMCLINFNFRKGKSMLFYYLISKIIYADF